MSEDVDLEISAVDPSVPTQAGFYLFHPGYTENLQTTTKRLNRRAQSDRRRVRHCQGVTSSNCPQVPIINSQLLRPEILSAY
jgi:hypothetical protein